MLFGCHLLYGSLIFKSSGKHCKCHEGHRHRDARLIELSWVEAKNSFESLGFRCDWQFPNNFQTNFYELVANITHRQYHDDNEPIRAHVSFKNHLYFRFYFFKVPLASFKICPSWAMLNPLYKQINHKACPGNSILHLGYRRTQP